MACCTGGDFVDLSLLVLTCILNCILDQVEPMHIAIVTAVRIGAGFALDVTAAILVIQANIDGMRDDGIITTIYVIIILVLVSYIFPFSVSLAQIITGELHVCLHRISFAFYKLSSIITVSILTIITAVYSSELTALGFFLYFVSGSDLLLNFSEMMFLFVAVYTGQTIKISPVADSNRGSEG